MSARSSTPPSRSWPRSATTVSPWTPSRSARRPPRRRSTDAGTPRRRWSSTPWPTQKATPPVPDSGDLRTDLLTAFCGMGGLTDHDTTQTFGAVMTALSTDPEFAAEFRTRVLQPKAQLSRTVFQRAADRGEVRDGPRPRPGGPGAGRDRPAPPLRDGRDPRAARSSSTSSTRSSCPLSGRRPEKRQAVTARKNSPR